MEDFLKSIGKQIRGNSKKDIVESATLAKRKRDRENWDDAHSEVSELLDDDLDL